MKQLIQIIILVSSTLTASAQETTTQKGVALELVTALGTESARFTYNNTNADFFFEARIGYKMNQYFELMAVGGYQHKNYLYFAEKAGNEVLLFMDRYYMPIGLNARVNISDFFYEKMKLWKKKDKWAVYLQGGPMVMLGKDKRDSRETELRAQGYNAPFYKYPYVIDRGRFYVSFLAGTRYNFNKNFGLFLEAGLGSLMYAQIGASVRFK